MPLVAFHLAYDAPVIQPNLKECLHEYINCSCEQDGLHNPHSERLWCELNVLKLTDGHKGQCFLSSMVFMREGSQRGLHDKMIRQHIISADTMFCNSANIVIR